MRVAIILMKYNPYGGYERQAAIVAKGLAQKGIDVTIIANEWMGDKVANINFVKIPIIALTSWLKILSFARRSRRYLEAHSFDVVIAFDRTYQMDIYRVGSACHREWLQFRKQQQSFLKNILMRFTLTHCVFNHLEKRLCNTLRQLMGKL